MAIPRIRTGNAAEMTRRDFLRQAGTAAAVATGTAVLGTAPMIIPSSAFAGPAPSDAMLFGCIGVGRQGRADMQELIYRGLETGARVVAVCDVDSKRSEDGRALAESIYAKELGAGKYKGVAAYRDFRELLARRDIDGVLIATPDFWHGPLGILAARAKKHIYLEKPLTYTIAEGRRLVGAVRKSERILQVGSQQRSEIYFLTACELVRNGRIGKPRTIRVSLPQDQGRGEPGPMPVPKNLDYDSWMGPTAEAPYAEDRVHPQASYERPGWMQVARCDHGMISNWGAHMVDIAQWGNGSEATGPVSITAEADFPARGLFDVHTRLKAEAVYADGTVMTICAGDDPAGVRFEGDEGWIFVRRGAIEASDPAILKRKVGPGELTLYRSGNHMKNFLECVRSGKEPAAPVEVGHRSNTICVMTMIAARLGRKLKWDPGTELFVGDDEANGMLDYPHRKPWNI